MKDGQSTLAELRRRIDDIDAELLELMNRRASVAQSIGSLKQAERRDFFRPEREAQVLRRLAGLNQGPLSREQVAFVFREIISACLALEVRLGVGYPRSDGFAGERAVRECFGRCVESRPVEDPPSLFRAVEAGEIDFGVVSREPFTPELAECFRSTMVLICAEGRLDAGREGSRRYCVVGELQPSPSGEDRTSLLLALGGADEGVDEVLGPFTRRGVDLSRIEPVKSESDGSARLLCVDARGHASDGPVAAALEELRRDQRVVKVLGSYPCGAGENPS